MTTSYADTWAALPSELRDRVGAAEPLTPEEWGALIRAGVPATTAQWAGGEPSRWRLPSGFRVWLADALEAEADGVDRMPERAGVLRERAARLRGE